MLPPASVTRASDASARNPSTSACTSSACMDAGRPSDSRARRGVPPMAAMSERFTASAFQPTSAGVLNRRSKWTPSTSASVVRISSAPRSGVTTAASSPMPTVSQAGAAGTRARICAMRSRSPTGAAAARPAPSPVEGLPGEFDGPGFTDDGHLDLSWVLELALDSLGDVLREPHGLLVRHAIAFDDDADFASGLEGEGLRDTLEGVGDALELLEPLDVGLEDVAARARARRRDGVGGLYDHRLERRPVDVHVVRGDALQDRRALPVLAER